MPWSLSSLRPEEASGHRPSAWRYSSSVGDCFVANAPCNDKRNTFSCVLSVMRARVVLLLALILAGCSAVTVGKCGPATEFLSMEEHRSMVIHPRGCYVAWDQPESPFEAERRALLLCSEMNPDSDTDCAVVATDDFVCPRNLKSWIRQQVENKRAAKTTPMQCGSGRAFETKGEPGTKPHPVDVPVHMVTKDAAAFFGLRDDDLLASDRIVFGRTRDSKSNWVVTEALHFVDHEGGKKTCIFKVSNRWDPTTKYFDTVYRVEFIGCFDAQSD